MNKQENITGKYTNLKFNFNSKKYCALIEKV